MRKGKRPSSSGAVAGNGLIDRRALLGAGVTIAGAMGTGSAPTSAAAEPLKDDPWSLEPGSSIKSYLAPSAFEKNVALTLTNPDGRPFVQNGRTPHHMLNGMITPNGLHFVVSYGGAPDIDPDTHLLLIHGLVERPLVFTLEALARYPRVSRITFVECGGNSAPLFSPEPIYKQTYRRCTASRLAPNGLVSSFPHCSKRPASIRRQSGLLPRGPTRLI